MSSHWMLIIFCQIYPWMLIIFPNHLYSMLLIIITMLLSPPPYSRFYLWFSINRYLLLLHRPYPLGSTEPVLRLPPWHTQSCCWNFIVNNRLCYTILFRDFYPTWTLFILHVWKETFGLSSFLSESTWLSIRILKDPRARSDQYPMPPSFLFILLDYVTLFISNLWFCLSTNGLTLDWLLSF